MTPFVIVKFVAVSSLLSASTLAAEPYYLSQQEAIDLDRDLFNNYKFSPAQLMELAGLSAASAIAYTYTRPCKVLVVCGPGNNGGDGLVCARHLQMFGYDTVLYYPNPTNRSLYKNLVHQCKSVNVTMLNDAPVPEVDELNREYKLIVDALFGVNFKPPVRQEFANVVENLRKTETPIASIDIPSGWHVESGPSENDLRPEFLISMSAPKQCVKFFDGKYHYLGGRFLPPALQEKFNMSQLPPYPANKCFVKLK